MFFAGIMEWKRLFNFRACLDVTEPEVTVEELGEDIEVISLGETIKLADFNLYLQIKSAILLQGGNSNTVN